MKKFILIALMLSASTAYAAVQTVTHRITSNSYYQFIQQDFNDPFGPLIVSEAPLSGLLVLSIDNQLSSGNGFIIDVDYSNIFINGRSFFGRAPDQLTTDAEGFLERLLVSGVHGDPDYTRFGNAILSPDPFICVECGYQYKLNLAANPLHGSPLLLSYNEYNIFNSGEVHFSLFISDVPLPSGFGLFFSALSILVLRSPILKSPTSHVKRLTAM